MKLESLTLRNFRNVESSSFTPDRRLNFLIGANGQGKTSFLEAIGYVATLRSFRGAKTEEVIRFGQLQGEIHAVLSDADEYGGTSEWRTELKIVFSEQTDTAGRTRTSKVAFINGKPYRSSTQYLSQRFESVRLGFHSVVFNPSDHDLVRGEPALRRGYLDRVLAAEDVEYLKTLSRYLRVVEQRNALLKSDGPVPRDVLLGFSESLVHSGSLLVYKRLEWLQRLRFRLDDIAHQIAPHQPRLDLFYLSGWVPEIDGLSTENKKLNVHSTLQGELPSLELLEQAFWRKLSLLEATELEARSSLVGPHRDDWTFVLGGRVLKGHGSQGEVRSTLLALKLSEIELFRERTGHRPLLLLDDFSSELDRERRGFLLRFLSETDLQVFVTTTEDFPHTGKRYQVKNGALLAPEEKAEEKTNEFATE